MHKKDRSSKVSIYIGIIFFLVLEVFSFVYVTYIKEREIESLNSASSCNFEEDIHFAENFLVDFSQTLYDRVLNKPEMSAILAKAAATTDEKKRSLLREKLFNLFDEDFKYMKSKSVRQLHFHLPNAVSFLRFHRPKKFGDSLVNVRPSIVYVNREKRSVNVFEEGRIFNAFRNVFPIFHEGSFVGTVEISYSFKAMQQELRSVKKTTLLFVLNSDIVTDKVFSSESSNYEKSEFKGFSYDKAVLNSQNDFSLKDLHILNKKISQKVAKKLQEKKNFTMVYQDPEFCDGHYIDINFLPVKNIEDKQVAYIIHYKINKMMKGTLQKYNMLLLTLSLLSLLIGFIVAVLLKQAKTKELIAKDIATYDALTKIYNRHGLDETMKLKIAEFKRYKREMSIIFFDIDHFKKVNDTYGHSIGDEVLVKLANVVQDSIRTSDIFARWGGEEFIIVLPETLLFDAQQLAEKIRLKIQIHNFQAPSNITCSFGVTEMSQDEGEEEMMKRVDEFLYRAKELGRNRVIHDIES